jgi:hypothetical protein
VRNEASAFPDKHDEEKQNQHQPRLESTPCFLPLHPADRDFLLNGANNGRTIFRNSHAAKAGDALQRLFQR